MSIHSDLVATARAWLKKGHSVVVTEIGNAGGECPDAIGFTGGFSTLIECKASRSDFLADKAKHFRRHPQLGMGTFRYYMAPAGLIAIDDLAPAWGLLEVQGNGKVRNRRKATPQPARAEGERALLVSVLRRVARLTPPGADVRFYPVLTSAYGTIGIEDETEDEDARWTQIVHNDCGMPIELCLCPDNPTLEKP